MPKIIQCPHLKARLTLIKSNDRKPYNWLFLPGGPGLGSESLAGLTGALDLPGTMWHVDLPNDGSHVISNDNYYFEQWPAALVEAVKAFNNVILVAHSTGAMYALATPELKNLLKGIVIMSSAPNAQWQIDFSVYVEQNPLPDAQEWLKIYTEHPTNAHLKQLTLASIPYVMGKGPAKDFSFFETLPYNAKACEWSARNFDSTYQAQWVPDTMPTLIIAGEYDRITPLRLFLDAQEFHYPKSMMRMIKNGGHFPWIDTIDGVRSVFLEYCDRLT